jgi:hypothetical protein
MTIPVLTTLGTVMCPHGGQVTLNTSQSDVEAEGGKVILVSDEHSIAGCAFQIPVGAGTKPQPCVKLRWQVGAMMATVNGTAVVNQASVGLCYSAEEIPQGPAIIASAASQTKAT